MSQIGVNKATPTADKYYCLIFHNNNYELQEKSGLGFDEKVIYWVKKIDTGQRWGTAMTGGRNQFEIYKYVILNSNFEETKIKIGNWTIESIFDPSPEKHSYRRTRFIISDMNGISETHQFFTEFQNTQRQQTFKYDEDAILYAVKFLNEFIDCDWKFVKMFYENQKLKDENQGLRKEVQILHDEIKNLKNK